MIRADVILDSISFVGVRLTTLLLEYPRFIHSQFMTHRMFSRNAASSRAIPVQKMLERVQQSPVVPIHWGKNRKGMQATEEVSEKDEALSLWFSARDAALQHAEQLMALGVHKQIANRLLEPFSHIQVVVSATEWENFFNLRLHDDAQPEIQALARAIKDAMDSSEPQARVYHIPFILEDEQDLPLADQLRVSVARCARTSYYYHDGRRSNIEEDKKLFERLAKNGHWSPFEHQAIVGVPDKFYANFKGWIQFRHSPQLQEVVGGFV